MLDQLFSTILLDNLKESLLFLKNKSVYIFSHLRSRIFTEFLFDKIICRFHILLVKVFFFSKLYSV